jgi:predicted DNA-binding transcriptional regulator AlpA
MLQKNEPRKILRRWEVEELTKLSPSWIYAMMKAGKFPSNFKILAGGRACGWWASDIEAFLESRDAGRA